MKHYFLLLLLIGCIASGQAESGWKAHWINTERCQSKTNTWLAFRKIVHIDKVPQLYRRFCLAQTGMGSVYLPSPSAANCRGCTLESLIQSYAVIKAIC